MRKHLTSIILAVMTGLFATNVMAGDSGKNTLPVAVDVKDGSRVVGTISVESARFIATYGSMKLAFRDIKTVEMSADHETAKIAMVNGDSLQGVLSLDKLTISSLIGDIDISLSSVTKITITRPDPPKK